MSVIELNDVSVTFHEGGRTVEAVKHVNISVEKGEIFGVLNSCEKLFTKSLRSSSVPESSSAALFALLLDERLGFLTGADILMDGGVTASGGSGLSK